MKVTYTIYGVVFTPAEKMRDGRAALVSPFDRGIAAESAVAADRALHLHFRRHAGGAYEPAEVLIAATLLPDAPMVPEAPDDAVTLFGVRQTTPTSPWTRIVRRERDTELNRMGSSLVVGKLLLQEANPGAAEIYAVKLPGWFVETRALSGSAHRGVPSPTCGLDLRPDRKGSRNLLQRARRGHTTQASI